MHETDPRTDSAVEQAIGLPWRFTMGRRSFLYECAKAGLAAGTLSLLVGCKKTVPVAPAPTGPLDPDNAKDAIIYSQLTARLGPVPKASKPYRIGVVVKFLGNEYWKLLADGMHSKADQYGIALDVQGAATESDPAGQLSIMQAMIDKQYEALLVSPQTDENLVPAVERARRAGILIVNVDDAVLKDAEHFVGPNQYENGIRAARYFAQKLPSGGEVAIIEGLAGVYAAKQRTAGFVTTLAGTNIKLIADVHGDWDLQKSLAAATSIIKQHPSIQGFYCNNDIMALGVVEAVNNAGRLGKIMVIGTDGIHAAYDSIRAGKLTATVDSFPFATGEVAVEVALRLLGGQTVPRVVFSPQNLVTRENADNPMPK